MLVKHHATHEYIMYCIAHCIIYNNIVYYVHTTYSYPYNVQHIVRTIMFMYSIQ